MYSGICIRCNEFSENLTRGLCRKCYCHLHHVGKHTDYPKVNRPTKTIQCVDCGNQTVNHGRLRCKLCYNKWYYNRPGFKEEDAKRKRDDRIARPEVYREKYLRRKQDKRRIVWRKQYVRRYYKDHAGHIKEYVRQWRRDNPSLVQLYSNEARARKVSAEGNTTSNQWRQMLEYYCQDGRCLCCREKFNSDDSCRLISIDHVIPLSEGGSDWPSNLQPLCCSCNSSKHLDNTDYRPDGGEFARGLMC